MKKEEVCRKGGVDVGLCGKRNARFSNTLIYIFYKFFSLKSDVKRAAHMVT